MKRLLFFDDFVAHYNDGIERHFHSPEWMEDKIFTDLDFPYGCQPASIVPAPAGGYYLYYVSVLSDLGTLAENAVLCVAHGENLLDWQVLKVKEEIVPGYPQIVQEWGGPVYYDLHDDDPSRRYKMAFANIKKVSVPGGISVVPCGAKVLCSSDGLKWRGMPGEDFHDGICDCVLSMLFNPHTKAYQINLRRGWGERRVCMVQSNDLKEWTKPMAIVHPCPADKPRSHFYGMPQFYYNSGEIFIGFLNVLEMPYNNISAGPAHCELVYSYNGIVWNRTFKPFMGLRKKGDYGGGSMYGDILMERENDILIYASATLEEHHRTKQCSDSGKQYSVALPGKLRKDGFVGLASTRGAGEITTECLKLNSPMVSLNVFAPFGGVKMQICSTDYQPIEGFTYQDCADIHGDYLGIEPRWQGENGLQDIIERFKEVRLQIRLEQAELFSINGDFGFNINPAAPAFESLI